MLTTTFPVRIYFRIKETAGPGAPGFEESPFLTGTIPFAEAASIRPI